MEDLQQLEQLLKAHDWYYQRSEDPRAYRRGSEQRQAIFEKIKELHNGNLGVEADELYNKYRRS
jgi:hypothetical protein